MDTRYKYQRTYHLLGTETVTSDDKILYDDTCLHGKEVSISLKMDGENTSMYPEFYHARSLDSSNHPSRDYVKGIWGRIKHDIPKGYRICGENLYQKHSIFYDELPSYFMVFNIWNEKNMSLTLDDTLEWCDMLGLVHVPIIARIKYDHKIIKKLFDGLDKTKNEGIVVSNTDTFHYDEFSQNVAKMVRKGHVQTDEHWMFSKPIINILKP